ncbi:Uncharacterised protein [Escherichia coli]|uniref:Uncharacterized protein n=1 Tax=Escherichia coli TaxID=562 RepID=A0A377DJL3_ECOLX|nr:Uncharacterised protein [Escherichia coli]
MWKKISNPQWADKEHTAVNCMVKFEHIEQAVPFTATASDTEAYGRDIYAACLRGEVGEIAEYVQPSISPEKARELKTAGSTPGGTEWNQPVIFSALMAVTGIMERKHRIALAHQLSQQKKAISRRSFSGQTQTTTTSP